MKATREKGHVKVGMRRVLVLSLVMMGALVLSMPSVQAAVVYDPGVENLGTDVNGATGDTGPTISGDGLRLVFSRGFATLFESTRASLTSPWGAASSAVFDDDVNDAGFSNWEPSMSYDGLSVYFQSLQGGSSRTWVTTRANLASNFGPETLLPAAVNDGSPNGAPSISKDELTLFFVPNGRAGGEGSTDIWQITRDSVLDDFDTLANVTNLGSLINTTGDDNGPSISADGLTLLFYRTDTIYRSDRACPSTACAWGAPSAFGLPINSADRDISPDFWDGIVYFQSDRPGGSGDWDLWATNPEPATMLIFGAGLFGLFARKRFSLHR